LRRERGFTPAHFILCRSNGLSDPFRCDLPLAGRLGRAPPSNPRGGETVRAAGGNVVPLVLLLLPPVDPLKSQLEELTDKFVLLEISVYSWIRSVAQESPVSWTRED
jgi:hypothetical protein